jgi:PAS domain S-box-containing protein
MEHTDAHLAYLDPDFNFIWVNSSYAKGSGHTINEIIGRNHFDLFPNEENQAIFEMVRDTGKPVEFNDKPFEYKYQPWRGITYWDLTLTPIKDSTGRVQGLVLSLLETTERKKLDQLKDDFIGLVSHELRSPLTVVIGAVNTVLSEGSRLSPQETRQLLEDAAWEADSLSHLLGNLLELSRSRADRLLLHAEPVRVENVVEDVVDGIRRQSLPHRFVIDIPKGLPSVHADQLRLERILYNLLENAVKYSPEGGEIRVFAKLETDCLVISVADEGVGISLENQARLFGPFQRLEESRLDGVKGAGLGLLVCRRLVEAHGGRIWVESEPSRGSSFFFTLPLRQTAT